MTDDETPEAPPIEEELEPAEGDNILSVGPVVVVLTTRCLVCAFETDNYRLLRTHCDENVGHFFVSICR